MTGTVVRRQWWLLMASWLLLAAPCQAAAPAGIGELLAAAARQPRLAVSELAAREGLLREQAAAAALLPKLHGFAKAELYNSPTNVRPMPPTEVNVAAGETIPFSREIIRYGLSLDMPLLVKSLYDLKAKREALAKKARLSHSLQLVSREAAVVAANSAFSSLVKLAAAINARLASLAKTREDLAVMVRTGRGARADLLKVGNSINDLKVQRNDLTARILEVRRQLETLTGLTVTEPVPMALAGEISPAPYLAEQIVAQQAAVARKELARRQSARLPALYLSGTLSGNQGTAYNTEEDFFRQYSFAGLTVRMPLFDRVLDSDQAIARVQLRKAEKELADTRLELAALERYLKSRLEVIDRSRALAGQALANNRELLKIAKVALAAGRTTTEEYLRYESQVLAAQASLYRTEDERWQTLSKLAVLYGQEFKGVVQ